MEHLNKCLWVSGTPFVMYVAHHQGVGRKLSKLAPKTEVNNELYRALLVLLEEKDPLKFEMLMNVFLSMCNEKSSNFGEYFQVS